MKRALHHGVVLTLVLAMLFPSFSAQAGGSLRRVGSDPVGDWTGPDPRLTEVGTAIGADLEAASIGSMARGKLRFVIKVASLPAVPRAASLPTGYMWHFVLNGTAYLLWSCDAFNSTVVGWVPDDYLCLNSGAGNSDIPFALLKDVGGPSPFELIDVFIGRADVDKGEISIDVPLGAIGANRGDQIQPITELIKGEATVWAYSGQLLDDAHDELQVTRPYRIP